MTDINELRRLAQDQAWIGRWYDAGCETLMAIRTDDTDGEAEEIAHPVPTGLVPYLVAVQPSKISDLLDRLEAAEKEREELRAVARHESACVDACMQEIDALKEEAARLRGGLALIADQYEPKCSLLIPSIARSALCATGAYGQNEKGIKFCLACGNSLQDSPEANP